MPYFFLSGGNEEAILGEIAKSKILHNLKVQNLLIIPFANNNKIAWEFSKIHLQMKLQVKTELLTFTQDGSENILKIENAEAYYILGGSPGRLLKALHDLQLMTAFRRHFLEGTVKLIYGGSAGEMVLGEKLMIGHTVVQKIVDGLNFLPHTILESHYTNRERKSRFLRELEKYPDFTGIAIDERTIVVMDSNLKVYELFGDGNLFIYNNNIEVIYDKNSTFETPDLCKN